MLPYILVFVNSLKASLVISLYAEISWFVAILFGGYNILLLTLAAIAGSAIGTGFNFWLGYYLGSKRGDWFAFSETLYQRMQRYNRYTMLLLLIPFSSMPVIGFFWGIYVLIVGMLHVDPRKALPLIVIGRAVYYGYYLLAGY